MAIILDADVLIRGEKGNFDLSGWLATRRDDEFEVAAITIAELWHGVERARGKQKSRREQYLRTVLGVLPIVTYTEHIACEHARLWANLQTAGKMIGYYDLIVAATALVRGGDVATFNKKHFSRVPGLIVIEPK